ncbi:hypothetical protein [Deinococcus ficus]|uniref:Uncharacterized protein n=1 Tax=Deinococcus ficus TaxID=317577 RepID=A0A221T2V1_9DEIO|nr:hypothetical protein [Deinococcus ficus]ASN83176.1 hypothetical protein DFI_18420 [Deinococcus ficus]
MLQDALTALTAQLSGMIGAAVRAELPRVTVSTPHGSTALHVDETGEYVTDEHNLTHSLAVPSVARISALFAWQPAARHADEDVQLLQEKSTADVTVYVTGSWPCGQGTVRGVRLVHGRTTAQRYGTLTAWVSAGVLHALLELEDPNRAGTCVLEYMERDLSDESEPF